MKSIMETSLKRIVHLLLLAALSILTVNAKVISYPAPKGETLSSDYMVEVDGVSVPVYMAKTQHHDKKYSIAYFDFSGTVTVKIALSEKKDFSIILQESR